MAQTDSRMIAPEAGWFGAPARPRFGWLHRPGASASGVGMVIVPPFGFEAVCAHRSLRHLAKLAAAAGMVTVQFDLDGSGDSAGDDLDPGRIEAWLASIDDACDLARSAGAERLVLFGVRLGAALATLAAPRRDDIAGLVAINGVTRGKAFLREGRALQMALDLQPAPVPASGNDRELVGFAISAETGDALTGMDLMSMTQRPAPNVLLIERDDLAADDRWAAHLRSLGAQVQVERLAGYAEMMLEPHNTVVPRDMLEATLQFAVTCEKLGSTPASSRDVALASRIALPHAATGITEAVHEIEPGLFAISSRPTAPMAQRGIVLLNAGAIGHCGPNRLYVTLARQLAATGNLVLRMDLSGLGDSEARAGATENVVYGDHALAEVGVAVAWLRAAGVRRVVALGLCSGGYHAYKAALDGQSIDRVGMINPLTFDYRPGMPLDFTQARVMAESRRYRASMRSSASWRKLLRGDVGIRHVAEIALRRLADVGMQHIRGLLRRLRVPLGNDLGASLQALADHGVDVDFIFAASDPGPTMLPEQAGSGLARLRASGAISVTVIDGPDHTFTARWTQPLLLDAINNLLAQDPSS